MTDSDPFFDRASKRIEKFEGFRARPYVCPAGYDTIGCGTRLPLTESQVAMLKKMDWLGEGDPITKEMALAMVWTDLRDFWGDMRARDELDEIIEICDDDRVSLVLLDMSYNCGVDGLLTFKRMLAALRGKHYRMAAHELLYNDKDCQVKTPYFTAVKGRAVINAALLVECAG